MKYKLIKYMLDANIYIGRKLVYLLSKYEANIYAEKNEKLDLRGISSRIKNVLLHAQDIIDKRWDECQKCEFLLKPTNNCKKCGCFMAVKTRVATASCPIGKWNAEFDFIKGRKVAPHPAQ